jgi:methylenetetrahydrofolate/methylenetetrahydromethanopterin dehydrogenase (NADP+)
VTITSRRGVDAAVVEALGKRFGGTIKSIILADGAKAAAALEGVNLLLNAGPAGVQMVPRDAWAGRAGLRAVADLNAVPPLGVEGVDVTDSAVQREGATVFGALGVGNLKMKVHKACIARLFERNDLVLDAETIAEVASGLGK